MSKEIDLKLEAVNVGDTLEHKLNKEYLMVLKIGKEQVQCRTKDFREIWFYPFELRAVNRL